MNIENLYGVPSEGDGELLWRLNDDRDEYVILEMLSKMKMPQCALIRHLKGKLTTTSVIIDIGNMKSVKRQDAEQIASFFRVPVTTLFITRGECRQRAMEIDAGTPIGGLEPHPGGCVRLG